ncbi:MAG: family 10 glycosylhydrolase, partial [bacterium]|nr:family 10 glycosylhydrolase [bacterium]
LHAWFNPYRVKHPSVKGPISPKSIMKKAPQWCLPLKKNYIWLDPSNPKVRQYVQGVILDCVRKYDVDGVHLDDYFYPYKDFLPTGGFPDFYKNKKYVKANPQSPMTRSAWRRHNVNTLIYSLHVNLKKLKPHVEFGISPFGIWRPGFPKQIKGTSAFDDLACDSRKWLVEGWVDYLSPQLYWPESAKQQQFSILLKWWCAQNPKNKQVIPGLASWRTDPKELLRQMKMSNDYSKSAGFLHFSLGAIQKNQSL